MKDLENLKIRQADGLAVLAVKVVPGSSRDKVAGVLGDSLKITTATAPEKGKANKAVAKTLAKALGLPPKALTLVSGQTNPHKEFSIEGLSEDEIRQRLAQSK